MPRPKTKDQLLAQAGENFSHLISLADALPAEVRDEPGVNGEWLVKDVLAHLDAWHHLFLTWHEVGSRGEKPEMPAPGYTWKTTPALNESIYEAHRDEPYETIIANLQASHQQVMDIIASYTDEELFTKKHYKWTGSTSLGSYAVSATSSHYDWALDLIKKWRKTLA